MRRPPNLAKIPPVPRSASLPVPEDPPQAPANYLDLYGLSKPPFGGPHDNAGYILFSSHRRAFELIIDHMVNGTGLLLVQGEEGIGKTATLRAAAAVAGESGLQTPVVSRLPGERTSLAQLVSALVGQDAVEETMPQEAIEHFLQTPRKALMIDDFDLLPEDCVQLVGSLVQRISDAPVEGTLILSSSTDLTADTKRPDLAQVVALAKNTVRMVRLGPAEIRQYIERSLWIAGGTTRRLITNDAMKVLIFRSGGAPGIVNRLMEATFTAGFARGDATITAKTVAAAVGSMASKPSRKENEHSDVIERAAQIVAISLFFIGISVFVYQGVRDRHEKPVVTPPKSVQTTPPVSVPVPRPAIDRLPLAKPAETLSPAVIAALIKRGDQSLELGDIAAARLLFQRAADAGNAGAATAMGKTFDPNYIPLGGRADLTQAVEWYQKALNLGDARAGELLKRLGPR